MKNNNYYFKLLCLILFLLTISLPVSASTYTYDNLGRLKTVTFENGQQIFYSYDAGGNRLSKKVTGTDAIAPTVNSTDPANNAINVPIEKAITVNFSEHILPDINFNAITLKASTTVVDYVYSINSNVMTIVPTTSLNYSTNYTIIIPAGAVKDISNNKIANDYTFTFTTKAEQL